MKRKKKTVFNSEKRHKLLRDFRSGTTQRKLAARHNVDQSTISRQLDIAIQERNKSVVAPMVQLDPDSVESMAEETL